MKRRFCQLLNILHLHGFFLITVLIQAFNSGFKYGEFHLFHFMDFISQYDAFLSQFIN